MDGGSGSEPSAGNRVVATMTVASTVFALFLHVVDFAARGHFAVAADDTAAAEGGEAEKPNDTHTVLQSAA
jgi:hypothetical protein